MENHDEVLRIWRDAEVHQRILVHIDAHHDMWWADDEADVNIGNFICPALSQGLSREVFWVVPDAAFENAKATKPVFKHTTRPACSAQACSSAIRRWRPSACT